jgi:hypothetical protein
LEIKGEIIMSEQKTDLPRKNLFKKLDTINITKHIRQSGKFSYLSWSDAWKIFKTECPEAEFKKHFFSHNGVDLPYTKDDKGNCYVCVTLSANGDKITEIYPVLNNYNKPQINAGAFDVNTALQRCLTKCMAYYGLGSSLYRGEDIPENTETEKVKVIHPIETKTSEEKSLDKYNFGYSGSPYRLFAINGTDVESEFTEPITWGEAVKRKIQESFSPQLVMKANQKELGRIIVDVADFKDITEKRKVNLIARLGNLEIFAKEQQSKRG